MPVQSKDARIPPQAPDAEKSVLGALIYGNNEKDTNKVLFAIASVLDEGDFFSPFHQKVWRSIFHLYGRKEAIDLITVTNEMRKDKGFNPAEDPIALTGLQWTSIHALDEHINIILQTSSLRKLISICRDVENKAWLQEDVIELWEGLQSEMRVFQERFKGNKTVHLSTVAPSVIDRLNRMEKGEVTAAAKFYFNDLDEKTGGMEEDDFVVVAGKGKDGKTTFVLQVAIENARKGVPVLIFSQEMSKQKILTRAGIIDADVYWLDALKHRLAPEDWNKLRSSVQKLGQLPIYINDSNNSINTIRAEVETYKQNLKIGLVVVDYIQIVSSAGSNAETREREVAEISAGLKLITKDFRIPVIALSQVTEDNKGKLTSRESKAIQNDLDKMITLRRPKEVKEEDIHDGMVDVEMELMQRMAPSGGFGSVKLGYRVRTGSFCELPPQGFPKDSIPIRGKNDNQELF